MTDQPTDEELIARGLFAGTLSRDPFPYDLGRQLAARLEAVLAERDAERARADEAEADNTRLRESHLRLGDYGDEFLARAEAAEADVSALRERGGWQRERAEAAESKAAKLRERVAALEAERAWLPIETAPKDSSEVLVRYESAGVEFVRNAWWSDGDNWEIQGFTSLEEARGWWCYRNSVAQEKLEGFEELTHWMPLPAPPQAAASDELRAITDRHKDRMFLREFGILVPLQAETPKPDAPARASDSEGEER